MKIRAITIEIAGDEIAKLPSGSGVETALRVRYNLDNNVHLMSMERKINGNGVFLIYKFERKGKI